MSFFQIQYKLAGPKTLFRKKRTKMRTSMKDKMNNAGQILLALLFVWGFNFATFSTSSQASAAKEAPEDCWKCLGTNCYLTIGVGDTLCFEGWHSEWGLWCGTAGDICWGDL